MDAAAHEYLGAPTAALVGASALAPGTRVTLPLLLRPAVVFPGETVPLKLLRAEAALLRAALGGDGGGSGGASTSTPPPLLGTVFGHFGREDVGGTHDADCVHLHCRVGVTLEVKSVHRQQPGGGGAISVVAHARQRFALPPDGAVRVVGGVAYADVTVLGDGSPRGRSPHGDAGARGDLHVHPSLWRRHDVDALCRQLYDDARAARLVGDEAHARAEAALAQRWQAAPAATDSPAAAPAEEQQQADGARLPPPTSAVTAVAAASPDGSGTDADAAAGVHTVVNADPADGALDDDPLPPPVRHAWQAVAGPDPAAFADWLARSLPTRASDKAGALAAPNVAVRLLALRHFLRRATAFYCCVECGRRVVARGDMLPLSGGGGISGVFVNPHGMVFRVQVSAARGVGGSCPTCSSCERGGGQSDMCFALITPARCCLLAAPRSPPPLLQTASAVVPGSCMSDSGVPPSHESSWFRGYAWTIVVCSGCQSLLGWRFDYMPRDCAGLVGRTVRFASRAELALLDDGHRAAVGLPHGEGDPLRPRMFAVPVSGAAAAAAALTGDGSGSEEEDVDADDYDEEDDGTDGEEAQQQEGAVEAASGEAGSDDSGDGNGDDDGSSADEQQQQQQQQQPVDPFGLSPAFLAAFLARVDDSLAVPDDAAVDAAGAAAVGDGDDDDGAGARLITAAGLAQDADVRTFLRRALDTYVLSAPAATAADGGNMRPTVAQFQAFLRELEGDQPLSAALVRRLLPAGSRPREAVVGPPPPGLPAAFYGFADGALELRVPPPQ
jgi:hypothetical protein